MSIFVPVARRWPHCDAPLSPKARLCSSKFDGDVSNVICAVVSRTRIRGGENLYSLSFTRLVFRIQPCVEDSGPDYSF